MITGTNALVAVRRKSGPDLPKVSSAPPPQTKGGTVVLQMLLGELASLKQQVNALAVAGPASIQPTSTSGTDNSTRRSSRVDPDELSDVVD